MEILNPYIEEFRETKVCRLCGSDNKENIDIFTSKPISSRSVDLLTKILTVYPLVLYKDDPLPHHICPNCIGNVSTTYQDIQQVMRQQNKWMNFTKAAQPEHKYFHILKVVENSTKAAKETIKSAYNIEINNVPLGKLLTITTKENQITTTTKTTEKDDSNEIVVKNIQNKLESNGFTIKRIKVPTSSNANDNDQELNDADTDSGEITDDYVTCNYCEQKFSNVKILAQHQVIHLKLSAKKVFQKHLLPKQLRRGRLITLNDNKYIRCLNCWRIYRDNKAILLHWSQGECEFYCFVCAEEFPHSPKMLREHVTEVHGIRYRSTRSEFMTNHSNQIKLAVPLEETPMKSINLYPEPTNPNAGIVKKSTYKKPPPKSCTKNDDGTITCKICHKVFDNFRSSNSHMRKHKPPNRYRETVAPSIALDKYNVEDDYESQPSTSKNYYGNTMATNPLHLNPPRPAYKVIMKNGPLRGIKTKFVQKRHDFLTNYATNNCNPANNSMPRTPDPSDNDSLIVPELLTSAMGSENMLINNTHNNGNDISAYGEYARNSLTQPIKSEPLYNSDYASQEQCSCFICNESFSNSREYELHAMFVHNIN